MVVISHPGLFEYVALSSDWRLRAAEGRFEILPRAGSRAYALGEQAHNGGNLYRVTTAGTSAAAGGPSGTGASITDGTVTWTFVQAGTDMTLDNTSVALGQQVTVTSFTLTAGGA